MGACRQMDCLGRYDGRKDKIASQEHLQINGTLEKVMRFSITTQYARGSTALLQQKTAIETMNWSNSHRNKSYLGELVLIVQLIGHVRLDTIFADIAGNFTIPMAVIV